MLPPYPDCRPRIPPAIQFTTSQRIPYGSMTRQPSKRPRIQLRTERHGLHSRTRCTCVDWICQQTPRLPAVHTTKIASINWRLCASDHGPICFGLMGHRRTMFSAIYYSSAQGTRGLGRVGVSGGCGPSRVVGIRRAEPDRIGVRSGIRCYVGPLRLAFRCSY